MWSLPVEALGRRRRRGDSAAARSAPVQTAKPLQPLVDKESVPPYLRNQYIVSGYRKGWSPEECLRSWFSLHNETLNIWTHFLGFLLFVGITIYTFAYRLRGEQFATTDKLVVLAFCLCAMFCMLSSTLFHTFNCVSASAYSLTFRIDLSGISLLILGSFIASVYFGFYCNSGARIAYTVTITCFASVAIAMPFILNPSAEKPWHVVLRNSVFFGMVFFGIVPLIHFYVAAEAPEILEFLWRMLAMLLVYGIAFVFFITRFPEVCAPGIFDTWCHSHQIWHVFVTLATYLTWRNVVDCLEYRTETPCGVLAPPWR